MTRPIKFRAWDKKRKQYVKVLKLYFGSNGHILGAQVEDYDSNFAFELQVAQFVLEQSTGLKDKNGKEICEGDIMEFGIAGAENRGVVGYEEDFGSYETYTSKGYIITSLFTSRGKIIGNIHENPELLEGEK